MAQAAPLERQSQPSSGWASRLRALLALNETLSSELSDDEALAKHIDALLVRNMRLFTLAVTLANLVWGVIDVVMMDPVTRDVCLLHRTVITLVLVVGTLALRSPALRARPMLVIGPVALLCGLTLGRWCALLGGPDTPWIHGTYVAALLPAVSPVTFRRRLVHTAAGFASVLLGYFGSRPEHLQHPLAWVVLSYTAFAWLVSVAAGEIFYTSYGRAFVATRHLDKLVLTLEKRVRAKTSDLAKLAQDLESRIEGERLRLAHTIHDELGQELAALKYAVSLASRRYASNPAAIAMNLDALEQLVERTGTTTRHLVTELRPKVLDERGLVGALAWLADSSSERLGFAVTLHVHGEEEDVPSSLALPAFRTVQEALTNIARHAQAENAVITLALTSQQLRVEVADDGVGMPDAPRRRTSAEGGMGLLGMAERAEALGGSLAITANDPRGTRITLTLPFEAEVP